MLDGIESEINGQPSKLAERKVSGGSLPKGSIFVGAGDSLVAGQLACILGGRDHRAYDPYFLFAAPGLAEGRTVVFVSVSGRTRSNIAALRKVRNLAKTSIALTSDPGSPLAEAADRVVAVPYDYVPKTPGTLSFTLTLQMALSMAGLTATIDFDRLFTLARARAGQLQISRNGGTLLLGNGPSYATSVYAAAKIHEFLGARAQAQLLEEFSHMELFSLRREDAVNILPSSDPAGLGRRLARALKRSGYVAGCIAPGGRQAVEETYYEVFLAQIAVFRMLKESGMDEPFFLRAKELLRASDSMIY